MRASASESGSVPNKSNLRQSTRRVVLATAQQDATAASSLQVGTERYRAGLKAAASRLAHLGALKPGLTVDDATDVSWFYFGYSGFFTLMDDNGWSPERAEVWLREMATLALLRD